MEANGRENLVNTRNLLWDEENRLLGVSDNGVVSNYWYDASGERVIKQTGDGEGVLVNGRMSGARTGTSVYSIYVNPYTVIGNGKRMSKHFYIGSQRIASQLCNSGSTGSSSNNPLTITKAADSLLNYPTKYANLTTNVKTRYDSLGVPYIGTDKNGEGFWSFSSSNNETNQQYFYHPDHLGSSSLITNYAKEIVQYLQYVPFGEVFVDDRYFTFATPYKFNAKELDEETGLYYYGARYYDPRTSLWLSVDPLAEKYPNVSSYVYSANNPVNYVDPDGRAVFYSRSGVNLGNDGVDDKKIYLMNEGYRPKMENQKINWGGKLDKESSNQLMKTSTQVGGLIIQDRIEEGSDYTISKFETVGNTENINGFMLEPAGPSTKESGKDRRIPEGVYDIEKYSSEKYPDNFLLSNKDVSKSRKILYHSGNNGGNTAGCNMPGVTKGNGYIGRSREKMNELRDFINTKGSSNVKTIINNKIQKVK